MMMVAVSTRSLGRILLLGILLLIVPQIQQYTRFVNDYYTHHLGLSMIENGQSQWSRSNTSTTSSSSNTYNNNPLEPSYRALLPTITFPPVDHNNDNNDNSSNIPPPRVVICAIIHSEERYVDEWLDYHLALGFSDIYISDNSPNHTLRAWNGTRSNRVHIYSTPNQQSTMLGRNLTGETLKHPWWQMNQYNDCADFLRQRQQEQQQNYYVAFFDVDEFLVLYNHSNVADFVADHIPDGGSLQINWLMFGTSNHSVFMDFPVTLRFQYRQPPVFYTTKMMVRLEDLKSVYVHTGRLWNGKKRRHFGNDPSAPIVEMCCVKNVTHAANMPAVLHHYYSKSLEETSRRFWCLSRDDCRRNSPMKVRPIFDDTTLRDDAAWKILTRNLPQYKVLEKPYQEALRRVYHDRQNEEYQMARDALMRAREQQQ